MHKVVIGLGSNIEPELNIIKARELIRQEFDVCSESEFVRTKPIGLVSQADFINGAILIETTLNVNDLEAKLKKIEVELGRIKTNIKSGPRTIDLDVIVYADEIVDNDFYNRDFLRNSVLELLPKLKYQEN